MIQVFDTHRLPYRNAQLRAYAQDTATAWLDFYDMDTSVGRTVYTNESGYICYGENKQTVQCLQVKEPAVIQVSLDNGLSWPIEWYLNNTIDPTAFHDSDLQDFSYYDSDGNPMSTKVLSKQPIKLPQYLLKTDYTAGDWAEGTIIVSTSDINGKSITIDKYTHLILMTGDTDSSGTVSFTLPDNSSLRAGQIIIVSSSRNIKFRFGEWPFTLEADHTYLLHNNYSKSTVVLTDITHQASLITTQQIVYGFTETNESYTKAIASNNVNVIKAVITIKGRLKNNTLGLRFDELNTPKTIDLFISVLYTDMVVNSGFKIEILGTKLNEPLANIELSEDTADEYWYAFRLFYPGGLAKCFVSEYK